MAQLPDPLDQTSPLLDLPGELRNRIYRAALLEDHIDVINASFTEPGLLRTCKLIRHEAGPIFYAENTFEIEVRDYDSAAIVKWTKKEDKIAKEFKVEEVSARVSKGPQTPHWQNLLTAAEQLATGEIKMYLYPSNGECGSDGNEKDLIQRIINIKTTPPTFALVQSVPMLKTFLDAAISLLHAMLAVENPLWRWQSDEDWNELDD